MAAHQATLSLGFSRQEHWSGLPFPFPMHEKWKVKVKSLSCVQTLSDPMDCSLPGSSVHGIFQARLLEWGAIAFSECMSRYSWIKHLEGHYPPSLLCSVTQLCRTLCNSMDSNLPGSSVHGIVQARILEWVAISFSRGSSPLRDQI